MTKTKTKIEKDPKCVIFSKSRRFEDIKYDTEVRGGRSKKIRKSAALAHQQHQQHQQNQQNRHKVGKSESGSQQSYLQFEIWSKL